MSSILTNTGAMVALQTLKNTNKDLATTQSQISTGKKVASAKDNAATWAVSKVMEADQSGFKVIQDQLGIAESTVSVGLAGAEQVTDILKSMKDLATSASKDGADYAKIQTDLAAKAAQIADIVDASQFNGINLLKTTINGAAGGPTSYTVLSSLNRSAPAGATTPDQIAVAAADFTTTIVAGVNAINITATAGSERTAAQTAVGTIETLIDTAVGKAAALGSSASRISDQKTFVSKLSDALKTGIGSLVDADMEETSARLQALQTQQQLGIQALSIANQAPQSILSLFR